MRNGTALRVIDQVSFLVKLDALIDVYALAMRPPPEQLAGRRSIMERHAGHPAFRAVIAAAGGEGRGEDSEDSKVIAFAYGFCGASGQWWHDVVRAGLTVATGQRAAAAWLADSFEIAEVHVHPEHQRQGIGRAMLLGLTAGCQQRTALLSGFSFPGNGPPYVVMGAVLPLRAEARPAG